MSLHYYKKFTLNQGLAFNGVKIGFEPIGNNEGVAILDDTINPDLVKFMEDYADKRRGGIVRISAEVHSNLKKSLTPLTPSPSPHRGLQQIRTYSPESLTPKSSGPPKTAAESAGAVLPVRALSSPPVVTQPTAVLDATNPNPAPSTFKPKRAKKSDVQAKVATTEQPSEE